MTQVLPHANQDIASERFALFDTLRFIAIVAIVWMHAVESPLGLRFQHVGRFGVPFFVMGSMLFMAQGLERRPELSWGSYLRSRVVRLYVPFLIWTAIYFGARHLKHAFFRSDSELALTWQSLYIGQAAHTWFLPFLLLINLGGFWIVRATQRHRGTAGSIAIALLLITLILFILPIPSVRDAPANHFLYCAWFALPSATLGLALALKWSLIRRTVQTRAVLLAGILLCVVALAVVIRNGRNVPLETLAGFGALVVSLQPSRGVYRVAQSIGGHSFDIYLSHVLFIECLQAVMKRAGVPVSVFTDLGIVIAAVVLSLALSVVTQRTVKRFGNAA